MVRSADNTPPLSTPSVASVPKNMHEQSEMLDRNTTLRAHAAARVPGPRTPPDYLASAPDWYWADENHTNAAHLTELSVDEVREAAWPYVRGLADTLGPSTQPPTLASETDTGGTLISVHIQVPNAPDSNESFHMNRVSGILKVATNTPSA